MTSIGTGTGLSSAEEWARREALARYGVLDEPASDELQALVRVASYVAGVPFATLNLLDATRQCQLTTVGFQGADSPRETSMCELTVQAGAAVNVVDASLDPRYRSNPWVTGDLARVRAYCSVPLLTPDGHALGTLCVFDTEPRDISDEQVARLVDCADLVVALFERQRIARLEREHNAEIEEQRDLLEVLLAKLRENEERLNELALHDPLTGLANRTLLLERLQHALALSARDGGTHAVLYCDLDGFKAVNDTHGHAVGDEVLVAVARRLTAVVRPSDTVARLGGDEFVVLCEQLGADGAGRVARRIEDVLLDPVPTTAGPVRVGVSIGVAQPVGGPATTAASALAAADEQMYLAKQARRFALPAQRGGVVTA